MADPIRDKALGWPWSTDNLSSHTATLVEARITPASLDRVHSSQEHPAEERLGFWLKQIVYRTKGVHLYVEPQWGTRELAALLCLKLLNWWLLLLFG